MRYARKGFNQPFRRETAGRPVRAARVMMLGPAVRGPSEPASSASTKAPYLATAVNWQQGGCPVRREGGETVAGRPTRGR